MSGDAKRSAGGSAAATIERDAVLRGTKTGRRSMDLTPGQKPEHLHIDGGWEDAVKKALKKPPPSGKPPTGKPPKGRGTKKPPGEERP